MISLLANRGLFLINTRVAACLCGLLIALPVMADGDYNWPGYRFETDTFSTEIKLRAQLRATSSEPEDLGFNDADAVRDKSVNRGRIKIGGKLGAEALTYYTEYDFPSSRLLDLRLTWALQPEMNLRVGQWKVPFNRERVDSSGKQQFVDRSISNRWFTLDRQRGLAFSQRLGVGSRLDSTWHVAVLEGTGRNGEGDADSPMVMGRYDWNFTGTPLAFSQSDTSYREAAAGVLTLLIADYTGPYTAFSSSGGGQLPGFNAGDQDRYDIRQYAIESAYQHAGFSWQQELHYKEVDDAFTGERSEMAGGYAQAGYFPHARWKALPRQLELALRYARVDPDVLFIDGDHEETTFAVNWFFAGHDSKLSFDVTWGKGRLDGRTSRFVEGSYRLYRLQWDFHV